MNEFEMVKIQGGIFKMGSSVFEDHATPIHVTQVDSFSIGKNLVTQKEYKAITGSNPSHFRVYKNPEKAKAYLSSASIKKIDFNNPALELEERPVETVSWFDAVIFCNRLSLAKGLVPCYSIKQSTNPDDWGDIPHKDPHHENINREYQIWNRITCNFKASGYRLPTEAEWEFAARGGKNQKPYAFSGSDFLDEVASPGCQTVPISLKKPNTLGIYDMSCNVWEWCWDWVARYSEKSIANPRGPSIGVYRAARGGSFNSSPGHCRITFRGGNVPEFKESHSFGIRLCRSEF